MKCLLNTDILIKMTKKLLGSCLQHNKIESHQIIKPFSCRLAYLLEGVLKFLREQM